MKFDVRFQETTRVSGNHCMKGIAISLRIYLPARP